MLTIYRQNFWFFTGWFALNFFCFLLAPLTFWVIPLLVLTHNLVMAKTFNVFFMPLVSQLRIYLMVFAMVLGVILNRLFDLPLLM